MVDGRVKATTDFEWKVRQAAIDFKLKTAGFRWKVRQSVIDFKLKTLGVGGLPHVLGFGSSAPCFPFPS